MYCMFNSEFIIWKLLTTDEKKDTQSREGFKVTWEREREKKFKRVWKKKSNTVEEGGSGITKYTKKKKKEKKKNKAVKKKN